MARTTSTNRNSPVRTLGYEYFINKNSSDNPAVTIGLALSISPRQYQPSSSERLEVILQACIVTSPKPGQPITLATWNNPFQSLGNRSYTNITCTSNPSKAITVWPETHWPKYGPRELNVREFWDFVPIHPGTTLQIKHEVPKAKIDAVKLEKGEKYKISLTDLGLGTSWWMYGTPEDDWVKDKKFMRWTSRGVEGEKRHRLDNVDTLGEPAEDQMWDDSEEWFMGEDPEKLALVMENEDAEFEVI